MAAARLQTYGAILIIIVAAAFVLNILYMSSTKDTNGGSKEPRSDARDPLQGVHRDPAPPLTWDAVPVADHDSAATRRTPQAAAGEDWRMPWQQPGQQEQPPQQQQQPQQQPAVCEPCPPAAAAAPPPPAAALHPELAAMVKAYPHLAKLAPFPVKDKYSVIIMSYRRPRHLEWQLKRLVQCPSVQSIHVMINSGPDSVSPSLTSWANGQGGPPIQFTFPPVNSLNNRFVPPKGLSTATTFMIDDDIEAPCAEIEWGFKQSKQYPGRIVGFFPRVATQDAGGRWQYVIPHYSKPHAVYNIVLTGSGVFFDSRWLHIYTELAPRAAYDYVAANMNCEDVLFNMVLSNATRLPPVLLVGSAHTTKQVTEDPGNHQGLRTQPKFGDGRSECLSHFVNAYKYMPLVNTDAMIVPFTFDKPALRQLMSSTQLHNDPFWWP